MLGRRVPRPTTTCGELRGNVQVKLRAHPIAQKRMHGCWTRAGDGFDTFVSKPFVTRRVNQAGGTGRYAWLSSRVVGQDLRITMASSSITVGRTHSNSASTRWA